MPTVTFAAGLRLVIQESGMSVRCVAMRAGVHYQTLYKFMRGERPLRNDIAEKVMRALRVTCELRKEKA